MSLLVHVIAASPVSDPPPGLRGAQLAFVPCGPLGAWVSEADDAATRDDALDHHRIVETLCSRAPCLPVRFGTRAPDASAVRDLVAPRADALRASLDRVGDRREIAVTLLWQGSRARPGRGHRIPAAATGGRAFLERKQADHAEADHRRAAAERLGRSLEEALAVEQADVRHAYCPSSEVAISTALLAPAGAGEEWKEHVVRVAAELEGVRAVVSGPWPPYTFAGTT